MNIGEVKESEGCFLIEVLNERGRQDAQWGGPARGGGREVTEKEATRQFVDGHEFVVLVYDERRRQDEEHGGPDHDDEHDQVDWKRFIHRQLLSGGDFEKMMVEVAALAMAAYESNRRKHGTDTR